MFPEELKAFVQALKSSVLPTDTVSITYSCTEGSRDWTLILKRGAVRVIVHRLPNFRISEMTPKFQVIRHVAEEYREVENFQSFLEAATSALQKITATENT